MKYLRIDDVGASSKKFLIYGHNSFKINHRYRRLAPAFVTNFLFIKHIPFISGWAVYKEMTFNHWINVLNFLERNNAILNVAITACWVEKDGTLTRFDKKYPESAEIIKYGVKRNLLYILNHGLTHCIPGKHLPLKFRSNQKFHREFSNFLNLKKQILHLERSQEILENIFGNYPKILVPPGNVYNEDTLISLKKVGIKTIQCDRNLRYQPEEEKLAIHNIRHIDNSEVEVIHDRDIVKNNPDYLKKFAENNKFNNMSQLV